MKELICVKCGEKFRVKDSRSNALYCSRKCYLEDRKDKGIRGTKCIECGALFVSKKSSQRKFCSHKCFLSYYKKQGYSWNKKDRVKVVCSICGKEEFVIKSRALKYRFCSKLCESKGKTKSLEEKNLISKLCPICGQKFIIKASSSERRVCCSKKCLYELKQKTSVGERNPNYKGFVIENGVRRKSYERYKDAHQRIVFDYFGIHIPPLYHIHHKDCNPKNNELSNLVVLPNTVHMLIHRWFGNILLSAITKNIISRKMFFSLCTDEQRILYENIIDLNITNQAVVKQGELLGNPEVDNQQPSIYRNIYVGSTTNSRVLTGNAEDSNADTSALLPKRNEDIV